MKFIHIASYVHRYIRITLADSKCTYVAETFVRKLATPMQTQLSLKIIIVELQF